MNYKEIIAALQVAVDGGATVETIKPSDIFICGPNSHNHIPGCYRSSRTGETHGYHECAVRDNHRGWIPRLREELERLGMADAKIEVEYAPNCCWVQGVGPTGIAWLQKPDGYKDIVGWNVPLSSDRAAEIQSTLPKGWVAKPTWWETHK